MYNMKFRIFCPSPHLGHTSLGHTPLGHTPSRPHTFPHNLITHSSELHFKFCSFWITTWNLRFFCPSPLRPHLLGPHPLGPHPLTTTHLPPQPNHTPYWTTFLILAILKYNMYFKIPPPGHTPCGHTPLKPHPLMATPSRESRGSHVIIGGLWGSPGVYEQDLTWFSKIVTSKKLWRNKIVTSKKSWRNVTEQTH